MHTSTVTKKGQIVIPAELRRRLGFAPGTKVVITEAEEGGVRVRPLGRDYFDRFAGLLGTEGRGSRTLLEERRADAAAEDASTRDRSSPPESRSAEE
jgi:AbrB family looped-hinge helix DNA binding protein